MADNYQALASRYVKLVRKEKGWSQEKLADKIDVAQSTIQRAEKEDYKHQTKLQTLFAIERVSGIRLPDALRNAPDAPAGIEDQGRDWGDPEPETHESPVYYQDWSGKIDPKRFKRFVEPMAADLLGEKAGKGLSAAQIKLEVDNCLAWVAAAREDDPSSTVTEHIAEYLWLLLARLAPNSDEEVDYPRWRRAARRAAESLME